MNTIYALIGPITGKAPLFTGHCSEHTFTWIAKGNESEDISAPWTACTLQKRQHSHAQCKSTVVSPLRKSHDKRGGRCFIGSHIASKDVCHQHLLSSAVFTVYFWKCVQHTLTLTLYERFPASYMSTSSSSFQKKGY